MNAHCIERLPMTESNQSVSSKLMRDIVALGKKHSKSGFPNPNRAGCPNRSSLRAMAYRDRHFALGELPISHVVGCSPCFQEYAHFRRMSFVLRGLQLTAASLAVFTMLFVATRLLRNHTGQSGQQSASEKQPERHPSEATKQPVPPTAPLVLSADLSSFSPTRGDAPDESGNSVHLPQKLLRVHFILPIGMEPGEYQIRLQDDAGTVFIDTQAQGHIWHGATAVEVDINLVGAHRGNFILMVHLPGLSWRRFPVVVD